MLDMIVLERRRRARESEIESHRERLRGTQDQLDRSLANLRHISRQRGDRAGVRAFFEANRQTLEAQKSRLIEAAYEHETQLAAMVDEQLQSEKRLFRATSGLIRNSQREDVEEAGTSRAFRHKLRVIAEYARSVRKLLTPGKSQNDGRIAVNFDTTGTPAMSSCFLADVRKQNIRKK